MCKIINQARSRIITIIYSTTAALLMIIAGGCPQPSPSESPEDFEVFQGVPNTEELGLVKSVSKPFIKGTPHPYNGSIVDFDGRNFLMTVRVDTGEFDRGYPITKIGLVTLNEKLNQVATTRFINTGLNSAEDTRIFKRGNEFWIVFNARRNDEFIRAMYIAKLEGLESPEKEITAAPVLLHFAPERNQKNWSPFVKEDVIYLTYGMYPHKVLRYDEIAKVVVPVAPELTSAEQMHEHLVWNDWIYGEPRGGTPAILHGNEYLGFFHSSFSKDGLKWYVFGAYTYETEAPFKIKRITKKPIVFRDNYTSILQPIVSQGNRVSFPAGIARRGNHFLVSYGENDSQTKIVSIDVERLEKMLVSPTSPKNDIKQ